MATDDDDDATAIRSKLRRAGFHPLPLTGKRPAMDKWSQKMNVNQDEIRLWHKLYPWSENTGILTANAPTVDIDIMVPEAAEAIQQLTKDTFEEKGRILTRFGKSPKRAIPLRTDDPFKKLVTNLLGPDGKAENKVEILGEGQQVVVHGIHPDTHKPYSWHGGQLGDVVRDELPYVHDFEAVNFIALCEDILIRDFGFSRPQPKVDPSAKKGNGAGEFHHANWTELVSNIIGGANVHDSIRDLAASFVASNIGPDTAVRLLQSLMLASTMAHDGHWQERFEDISRAVIGALKFMRGDKPAVLKFVDMSAWDAVRAPERLWAVTERIPIRQTTLLSGEGSIGKTILELQLCIAHVLGLDWIGSLPEKGPAIYLGAEDDADELHRRLQAIVDAIRQAFPNSCFRALIDNGLHLLSYAGEDCLLGVPNRTGQIVATKLYELLLEAVNDIKPKHIGIDTAADVFGGNEVDRAQVRQFIAMLRKLAIVCNGSVVLLAHPSLEGIRSGTGISGSTAWHNSVRARMYFKAANDDMDTDLRELEFKKNNYGPVAHSIKLEYHKGIFRPQHSQSPLEKAAAERRADDLFLDVFQKLIAQGRADFSISKNAAEYVPRQIAAHPDGKEFQMTEYADAMERLLAANKLHIASVGPKSKPRQRLALGPAPQGGMFEDSS